MPPPCTRARSDHAADSLSAEDLRAQPPAKHALDSTIIPPDAIQAVWELCAFCQSGSAAPSDHCISQHRIDGLRIIARTIGENAALFAQCIGKRLGHQGVSGDLNLQMRVLEQALVAALSAPYACLKAAARTKAYKRRFTILREDFGNVVGTHVLQALAAEPPTVVAALVALKEAAAAFLLEHETLFVGCLRT